MSKFKPVKKTTFLEAVAATIQHEKEVFDFYLNNAESLPEGKIRNLFFQLAEDVSDHIKMIEDLYSDVQQGETLPNLKMLSEVHKFHTTSLQILMRRLDRNTAQHAKGNELDAVSLAMREHEDAAEFYKKIANKFDDPNIKNLFVRLSRFQEECTMLMESYATYETQGTSQSQIQGYWDESD